VEFARRKRNERAREVEREKGSGTGVAACELVDLGLHLFNEVTGVLQLLLSPTPHHPSVSTHTKRRAKNLIKFN
jgi:hypothetical protein